VNRLQLKAYNGTSEKEPKAKKGILFSHHNSLLSSRVDPSGFTFFGALELYFSMIRGTVFRRSLIVYKPGYIDYIGYKPV